MKARTTRSEQPGHGRLREREGLEDARVGERIQAVADLAKTHLAEAELAQTQLTILELQHVWGGVSQAAAEHVGDAPNVVLHRHRPAARDCLLLVAVAKRRGVLQAEARNHSRDALLVAKRRGVLEARNHSRNALLQTNVRIRVLQAQARNHSRDTLLQTD